MREGETSSKLIRNNKPSFYVKPIDPHSGQALGEYNLPFHPGSFDWPEGRYEVVSNVKDPFKLAVKKFYTASEPKTIFVERPRRLADGEDPTPAQAARGKRVRRRLRDRRGALVRPPTRPGPRTVKDLDGVAQFIFQYNVSHEIFDDFLNPPGRPRPARRGPAAIRLEGRQARNPSTSGSTTPRPARRSSLPDSDLTAFVLVGTETLSDVKYRTLLGDDELDTVKFKVRKARRGGNRAYRLRLAPHDPADHPGQGPGGAGPPNLLVSINYFLPPVVEPAGQRPIRRDRGDGRRPR